MPAVKDYPSPFTQALMLRDFEQSQGPEGGKLREVVHKALAESEGVSSGAPYTRPTSRIGAIQRAIHEAHDLLCLENDWDTEGSPAISDETWHRAVEFLRRHANRVWQLYDTEIDPPKILPGPEGSIDLHWDFPGYELLINIPCDPDAMAQCYGDDRGKVRIKATFDPNSDNEGVLLWLRNATKNVG